MASSPAPLLSLVCPLFNEEGCIPEFHRRALDAVRSISPPVRAEIIYVDDGSRDRSAEIIRQLCAADPTIKLIELSRNFGHQFAITAGIDAAAGDAVVVIDSDLQDPPEVIPAMVGRWREGNHVVYGVRTRRSDESRFKRWTASAFYRLLNRCSDVDMPLDSGDFRLLDRAVVDQLCVMRERNRYVRGMVAWVGFTQCALPYERAGRATGRTGYTFQKMLRLAVDALTSFSEKPLRLALKAGLFTTAAALALAAWIVAGKIVSPERALPGFASLMVAVLLLGGIQLSCVGLLGEYVARIYLESKDRPLYVVARCTNLAAHREVHLDEGAPAPRPLPAQGPEVESRPAG